MPWPPAPVPFLLAMKADDPVAAKPADAAVPVAAPATAKTTAKTGTAAPAAAPESSLPTIIILGPIFLLFYLLLIRPQQRQEKKRRSLVDSLKKNDKVLTSAGIYGTVVSVEADQDKVVLRVDDDKGVKFTFSKASIVRVIDAKPEKAPELSS